MFATNVEIEINCVETKNSHVMHISIGNIEFPLWIWFHLLTAVRRVAKN